MATFCWLSWVFLCFRHHHVSDSDFLCLQQLQCLNTVEVLDSYYRPDPKDPSWVVYEPSPRLLHLSSDLQKVTNHRVRVITSSHRDPLTCHCVWPIRESDQPQTLTAPGRNTCCDFTCGGGLSSQQKTSYPKDFLNLFWTVSLVWNYWIFEWYYWTKCAFSGETVSLLPAAITVAWCVKFLNISKSMLNGITAAVDGFNYEVLEHQKDFKLKQSQFEGNSICCSFNSCNFYFVYGVTAFTLIQFKSKSMMKFVFFLKLSLLTLSNCFFLQPVHMFKQNSIRKL